MKKLKYIGTTLFLFLGIGQTVPIHLILSGFLQDQGGDDSVYFLGKLAGHIVAAVLVLTLASVLYKSARKHGELQ